MEGASKIILKSFTDTLKEKGYDNLVIGDLYKSDDIEVNISNHLYDHGVTLLDKPGIQGFGYDMGAFPIALLGFKTDKQAQIRINWY